MGASRSNREVANRAVGVANRTIRSPLPPEPSLVATACSRSTIPPFDRCQRTLRHMLESPKPSVGGDGYGDGDAAGDADPAAFLSRFSWRILLCLWIAFWVVLFLLGLQEYRWQGGQGIWQLSAKYGTAAAVSTAVGVVQLARASRIDHLLSRPVVWFVSLWKWLPVETSCFLVAMFTVPRAIAWVFGLRYDSAEWLEGEVHDGVKFLFFYVLAGGIQFGIHSYWAWSNGRVKLSEQARLAQQAQLAQLTQQLQPHFLFNGINLISSLIHSDPNLADALLGRLATLLRAATSASRRSQQTLTHELTLLHAYADIMEQRFADRVQLEWDIDEGAAGCLVPTFGLQPLLENCFQHVVERRTAPTRIIVRAQRLAASLRIEVEDDGESIMDVPVFGVGLGNLQRRLRSLHGTEASLTLIPGPMRGLVVRVELPCEC